MPASDMTAEQLSQNGIVLRERFIIDDDTIAIPPAHRVDLPIAFAAALDDAQRFAITREANPDTARSASLEEFVFLARHNLIGPALSWRARNDAFIGANRERVTDELASAGRAFRSQFADALHEADLAPPSLSPPR